jgi:hypothetical protein
MEPLSISIIAAAVASIAYAALETSDTLLLLAARKSRDPDTMETIHILVQKLKRLAQASSMLQATVLTGQLDGRNWLTKDTVIQNGLRAISEAQKKVELLESANRSVFSEILMRKQFRLELQKVKSFVERADISIRWIVDLPDETTTEQEPYPTSKSSEAMRFDLSRADKQSKTHVALIQTLSPHDHNKRHHQKSRLRIDGIALWFLEHRKYEDWKLKRNPPILYLSGAHGSGKSFLWYIALLSLWIS